MKSTASLPYHEPDIYNILIQAGFILLLNIVDFALDKALYCGLLGQILLGIAWGTPGAGWLGPAIEGAVSQLGYLGLLLLVYHGGLSTSLEPFTANLFLSAGVALTGIGLPIALSFILGKLVDATPIQCFAAGAALCSTSLGTTFTVLKTSGLIETRLGVVLSSAAIMDDVVGLVMVQIISNLGHAGASIKATVVIRPLLVSLALSLVAPLLCYFVARPTTLRLQTLRANKRDSRLEFVLDSSATPFMLHTLILLSYVTAATFAGTSNLLAAYIAGVSINWWDTQFSPEDAEIESEPSAVSGENNVSSVDGDETEHTTSEIHHQPDTRSTIPSEHSATEKTSSGQEVYRRCFLAPVDRLLRPFFFASIGFSIPVREMFSGEIIWKGLVYTVVMAFAKMACGVWLLRLPIELNKVKQAIKHLKSHVHRLPRPRLDHFWGKKKDGGTATEAPSHADHPSATSADEQSPPRTSPTDGSSAPDGCPAQTPYTDSAHIKPLSLYPASILGCAMTARGEIGFLISSVAESNGVFASRRDRNSSSDIFLIVTWAITLCTALGPPAVGFIVRRVKMFKQGVERQGHVVRGDVLGVWGTS